MQNPRKPYLTAVFVLAGILTLSFVYLIFGGFKNKDKYSQQRDPASSGNYNQGSGQYEIPMAFLRSPVSKGPASDRVEAEKSSGIRTARARIIRLNPAAFYQHGGRTENREVAFNLFDNLIIKVVLYKPSSLGVNYYRFQGRVDGDQYSFVDLIFDGTAMTGTIETNGRKFRIVNLSASEHFIIEETYSP